MKRLRVVIVTPALADANNGNWQTARRWQLLLASHHSVRLARAWPDEAAAGDQVMLALHARRSSASVQAWMAARGAAGLGVALTGTDLYRDLPAGDAPAWQSVEAACRLVVLQDQAPLSLPAALRPKVRVIFQSTGQRQTLHKTTRHLRAVAVGHLRDEKDPLTLMAAARLIAPDEGLLIDHIGHALDPALGAAALATARDCPHYRWLGGLPHGLALRRLQRAHLLVHPSRMEGGAHVVMEAVRSGTPVLASRMAGNVGMLGSDYGGYFEVGDARGLADALRRCRSEQAQAEGATLARWSRQCAARAPLFDPATERQALCRLIDELHRAAAPQSLHASP